MKNLVNQHAGAGNNRAKARYTKQTETRARAAIGPRPTTKRLFVNSAESLCSIAAFVVNSEPHTGARPSVRVCVWGKNFLPQFRYNPMNTRLTCRDTPDTKEARGLKKRYSSVNIPATRLHEVFFFALN
jgi:hypothetical protein